MVLKGGQSNRRYYARFSFKYLSREKSIENIGFRDFINKRLLNFLIFLKKKIKV